MIPPVWLPLLAQLNGLPPGVRIPWVPSGIRDVDTPCTDFDPAGKAYEDGPGAGQCEDTALVTTRVSGEHCPVRDAERVLREEAEERERHAARAKALAGSAEARRTSLI